MTAANIYCSIECPPAIRSANDCFAGLPPGDKLTPTSNILLNYLQQLLAFRRAETHTGDGACVGEGVLASRPLWLRGVPAGKQTQAGRVTHTAQVSCGCAVNDINYTRLQRIAKSTSSSIMMYLSNTTAPQSQ